MSDLTEAWIVGYTEGEYPDGASDVHLAVCLSEERANELVKEYEARIERINAALKEYNEQIKPYAVAHPRIDFPQLLPQPPKPNKKKATAQQMAEWEKIDAENTKISRKHGEEQRVWFEAWKEEQKRILVGLGLTDADLEEVSGHVYPFWSQPIVRSYYAENLPLVW